MLDDSISHTSLRGSSEFPLQNTNLPRTELNHLNAVLSALKTGEGELDETQRKEKIVEIKNKIKDVCIKNTVLYKIDIKNLKMDYKELKMKYQNASDPAARVSFYVQKERVKARIIETQAKITGLKEMQRSIWLRKVEARAKTAMNKTFKLIRGPKVGSIAMRSTSPFNPRTYLQFSMDLGNAIGSAVKLVRIKKQLAFLERLEKKGAEELEKVNAEIESLRIQNPNDPKLKTLETAKTNLEENLAALQASKMSLEPGRRQKELIAGVPGLAVSGTGVGLGIAGLIAAIHGSSMVLMGVTLAGAVLYAVVVAPYVLLDFLVTRSNLKNASKSLANLKMRSVNYASSLGKKRVEVALKQQYTKELRELSTSSQECFEGVLRPYIDQRLKGKILEEWLYRAADVLFVASVGALVGAAAAGVATGGIGFVAMIVPVAIALSGTLLTFFAHDLAKLVVGLQARVMKGEKKPSGEEFLEKVYEQMGKEFARWEELKSTGLHSHSNLFILFLMVKDYYPRKMYQGIPEEDLPEAAKKWAEGLLGDDSAENKRRFHKVLGERLTKHESQAPIFKTRKISKFEW